MVKKLKWNLILMSLLYVGLGIFLVMKPGTALNIVCYALGGVVLACAAVQLIRYFVVERGVFQSQLTLISGLICLALGVFLLLRSDIVVSILPIVFGLFVIFDAIGRVQNALDLRRCGYDSWKGFLLLPVLSVVLGVILIANPFGAMETLVMAIGVILIVEGAINLLSALYTVLAVRRFAKLHPETQSVLESITGEDIKEIRKNAIHAGLKLVDCPIRHLGTEKAQELYLAIQNYLADNGVEMRFNTECENIILEEEGCKGVLLKDGDSLLPVYADEVVIGTGRRGADWLEKLCAEHHIAHKPGTVDIGVRVECRNEVMEKVNKVLYESKLIGYPKPWKNKVRTFCQNPGGFVAQENYDNDLAVVNGHSFKEKKSPNTNLAILVSHNFTEPFNQPIAYAQKVGELTNMLGAGHIMVQRYGDILDGKRTWQKELAQSNVKPTLKDAVAGDITAAMPYRAMTNIIEFIKMLDMVVPGFAANETLLYSPELKFYSNKVKMDENLDTNIQGLHCLGDSSGWTRGLMMASVMGVLMGRKLAEKEGC